MERSDIVGMVLRIGLLLPLCVNVALGQVRWRGLYDVGRPNDPHPQQVARLEMAVGPAEQTTGKRWVRLVVTKVNGDVMTVWFRTTGKPWQTEGKEAVHIDRYILQEPGRAATEYLDRRTGDALLPAFGFVDKLLPHANDTDGTVPFARGAYLGQPLTLQRVLEPQEVAPPEEVRKLVLRSDLIVGTSRNFRDDGSGRKDRATDYRYVPFTEADYDEMIAAGINYFTARDEQIAWICHRPVFYDGHGETIAFPEELYRPNFLGWRMFIDEPACRLAGQYPPGASLEQAVTMIHEHIATKLDGTDYRHWLVKHGLNLGTLTLTEPALPIWETYIETSYYQLEANPYGIVQECRWRIDPNADSEQTLMLQRINETFGVDIPVTPENLFLWSYAQMRGAARVFGAKWGMSIYGQAEPPLRLASMKLAYDLGAEFIWFWTSDHDHHVPYPEQLRLARAIRDYAESRPARDLDTLRRAATTAIVIPYGYSLPTCWQLFTWGTHIYPLDRRNEHGLTYRAVLRPAVWEIERCLKAGIPYDVVPDGAGFDPNGYECVIRITADGRVSIERQ